MTRLRRGYGEAGDSRWIGFSRRRSQIIRQRRKNQAAKAAYAANALRTTRSTPRRPRGSIGSFTRTIIARGYAVPFCVVLFRLGTNSVCTCDRGLPPRPNVDQRTSAMSWQLASAYLHICALIHDIGGSSARRRGGGERAIELLHVLPRSQSGRLWTGDHWTTSWLISIDPSRLARRNHLHCDRHCRGGALVPQQMYVPAA
jgi:hypothetical protein